MNYENKQFCIKKDMIEKFKENHEEFGFYFIETDETYLNITTSDGACPDNVIQISVEPEKNWIVHTGVLNSDYNGFDLRV